MASMEPSEDEVSQVVDFAGLNPVDDRTMIINALRVCLHIATDSSRGITGYLLRPISCRIIIAMSKLLLCNTLTILSRYVALPSTCVLHAVGEMEQMLTCIVAVPTKICVGLERINVFSR